MDHKTKKICLSLIVITIIIAICSVVFGTKTINLFTLSDNPIDQQIIWDLRLPRTIAAITSGMTLAASGLLIQIGMNNQLADSSILGFQSGATLMALIIMLAFPALYPVLPLFAFVGGLLVYLIVFAIAQKNRSAIFLIVAGIAISSVIRSLINLVSQLFAENLENTISWMNGSLNTVQFDEAQLMLIYSVIMLIIALIIATRVEILLMDDDYLQNLGLNTNRYRFLTSSVAILLASISVSFVGTIGFVGLLAPHISRRLVNNRAINLMPTSILIGGILVAGSDFLQRIVFPIYEIPVGIIMSFIGGIYLVVLLIRSNHVTVS